MSRFPGDRPVDGPSRPPRPTAGRPRRRSLLCQETADDPDQGIGLYEAVASQDTVGLSADEWADRLDALQRMKSRMAAWEAEAIAGFDDSLHGVSADLGHRHPEPGDRAAAPGERRWHAGDLRSVADEIALILNLQKNHATRRIHTSCELVHNFPATLQALREGELTERAAFTIVDQLSVLDDITDLRAAEAAVLKWARTHPLTDLKKECQREAARRSPVASDKRHQRAHDERSVRMIPDGDGRAVLVHNQDAVDAAAIMTSLSSAAARARRNGDPRTTDQLRADIAMRRLLPGTKNQTSGPATDQPRGATCTITGTGLVTDITDIDTDTDTDHPAGNTDEPPSRPDDQPPVPECAPDFADETPIGAEATVVIHATAAEVDALLNGEAATGGEADHHGPIPQSSLRKHLIKALASTLLPNLPTTPNSPHPGATTRRPRTAAASDPRPTNTRDAPGTTSPTRHPPPPPPASPRAPPHRTHRPHQRLRQHRHRRSAHTPPPTPASPRAPPHHTTPAPPTPTTTLASSRRTALTPATPALTATLPRTATATMWIELRITDRPPPSDPDRYTPSAALDRYVRLRDRTCQFPGCNQPAEFADLDHRIPFAAGGRTTAANLWCLCRHHHRLKHEGGWQIHPNLDGSWTWTSPTGRRYRNNPSTIDPPDLTQRATSPDSAERPAHPPRGTTDPARLRGTSDPTRPHRTSTAPSDPAERVTHRPRGTTDPTRPHPTSNVTWLRGRPTRPAPRNG